MITHLRGAFTELTPTTLVVECHGVGYLVHISLTTYSALSAQREGKVLTTSIIRDDAHLLYGFATEAERELFGLLTSVSGVGPNMARVILSQYTPSELRSILALGQVEPLKAVKGIGLKTAQRIVLELKGKLELSDESASLTPTMVVHGASASPVADEGLSALKMLGFAENATLKVIKQIMAQEPTITVEQLIKQALGQL